MRGPKALLGKASRRRVAAVLSSLFIVALLLTTSLPRALSQSETFTSEIYLTSGQVGGSGYAAVGGSDSGSGTNTANDQNCSFTESGTASAITEATYGNASATNNQEASGPCGEELEPEIIDSAVFSGSCSGSATDLTPCISFVYNFTGSATATVQYGATATNAENGASAEIIPQLTILTTGGSVDGEDYAGCGGGFDSADSSCTVSPPGGNSTTTYGVLTATEPFSMNGSLAPGSPVTSGESVTWQVYLGNSISAQDGVQCNNPNLCDPLGSTGSPDSAEVSFQSSLTIVTTGDVTVSPTASQTACSESPSTPGCPSTSTTTSSSSSSTSSSSTSSSSTSTSSTSTTSTSTTRTTTSTTSVGPPVQADTLTRLTLSPTSGALQAGLGGTLSSTLTPVVVGTAFNSEYPAGTVAGNPAGITVSFDPVGYYGAPPTGTFTVSISVGPDVPVGNYTVTVDDVILPSGGDCSGTCVKPVYTVAVEPPGAPGVSLQVTLQDAVNAAGANVPPVTAPLTDGVSVADAYEQPITAALSDSVRAADSYLAPVVVGLSDLVSAVGGYVAPVTAALSDGVGLMDQLKVSPQAVAALTGLGLVAVGLAALLLVRKRPEKKN